ncbi:conjugative transposon protein TraK [Mucilaginibacter sp. X5P1]|uniref:conjugative transposon protein TraK n=1 Tax=Mucilaginibacter sp. X5P1 TaxID=2723088 RepID=UPI0016139E0A|nr:conjugative transposon protein TraK [Mucilaginibacter sp. X5P1]MBB6137662.1 conjugative transposon TraK protein [Mucilaginibacter sp. X5P1]
MLIKNIEAKIRLSTFIAFGSFLTAVIIAVAALAFASRQVSDSRKVIYLLDNNMALSAKETDLSLHRPQQYRGTIALFHALFFSLTPDDKYIEYQMKQAMYLIDESGVEQYNTLKENGYFNSILSSSSVLTLTMDSISLDMRRKYFRYYGKLRIDRRSSTVIRSLITEGYLEDIKSSDNNCNGVLITNWKTIENKDLSNVPKNTL